MTRHDTPYQQGAPCWVDLMARNREQAWAFYGAVLGWNIVDSGPDMGHYGLAMVGQDPVAGIGSVADPEHAPPPMWITYLACDDLEATLALAEKLGATIAVPPMEVPKTGRMAMLLDPNGAAVGLWEHGEFVGAALRAQVGAVAWSENMSRNLTSAREFYATLFDYTYTAMPGGFEYVTADSDDPTEPFCGLGVLQAEVPAHIPSHWMTYFEVANVDAAASAAATHGGTVTLPPFDTAFGRMSVITDPDGAVFSVMQRPVSV